MSIETTVLGLELNILDEAPRYSTRTRAREVEVEGDAQRDKEASEFWARTR